MDADQWRIEDTADYVCSRNFSVVTLQFPDEYLDSAAEVCRALQASCQGRGHAIQVTLCTALRHPLERCFRQRVA